MKNNYEILDEQAFDENSLHPGEIGVEAQKFTERDNKGEPIIELMLQIFWAADEENQEHVGKTFKWAIFFGKGKDSTPRILKDVFKNGGFEVGTWNEDGLPMRQAMPGSIKLLVHRRVPIIGKITASIKDGKSRNFFNVKKIARENPETGKEYPDALPAVVTNAMVMESFGAVLEGESPDSLV